LLKSRIALIIRTNGLPMVIGPSHAGKNVPAKTNGMVIMRQLYRRELLDLRNNPEDMEFVAAVTQDALQPDGAKWAEALRQLAAQKRAELAKTETTNER